MSMFTWKPIYVELATKLLGYRDRRTEIIKVLADAATRGLKVIKLSDQNPKGKTIPLADVDPFTFFASFNRGGTDAGRKGIMQFVKQAFSLKSPPPDDFAGLPVVNPQNSWFFAYAYQRPDGDIDALWDFAEAVITRDSKEIEPDLFARCLKVKFASSVNLTMGLFWFRPDAYLALDKKNKALLKKEGIESTIKDWQSYLDLLAQVRSRLGTDYADISHKAHLMAVGKDIPTDSKDASTSSKLQETSETSGEIGNLPSRHPLNTILYGPPGTGKTYSSFSRAVRIIDGTLPPGDFKNTKARFDRLVKDGQIGFVTFHQSYSYEDFVEGIRPDVDSSEKATIWKTRDGLFKILCSRAQTAPAEASVDFEKIRIWKMSLGNKTKREDDHIYPDCISGNFIAHGSGRGMDFSECQTKEEIEQKLEVLDWSNWPTTLSSQVSQIAALKLKMKIGDLVIVPDALSGFRAIGKISGEYSYNKDFVYQQQRAVTWLRVFKESQPAVRILKDRNFMELTLYELRKDNLELDVLRSLISSRAEASNNKNYVLIIDEINRGNISKIFGELITLLEPDKRIGASHQLEVILPYSQKAFGVPVNLYIIGTMNTADKSIALVDVALRRRFVFEELMPDFSYCKSLTDDMRSVLRVMNERIALRKDRDHQIGHSYFIDVNDAASFNNVFEKNIMPLLQEYFWNDWDGLRFVFEEEHPDNGKFVVPIPGCEIRGARNKWQWFSDAGTTSFDCLSQLLKNYFPEP